MKRGTIEYYRVHWRRTGGLEPGEEKREKRYDWILQSMLERHGRGPGEEKHEKRYDLITQSILERLYA